MKKISLTRGLYAIVDDDDYQLLTSYKWYAKPQNGGKFSAARNSPSNEDGKKTPIYMHRQILSSSCSGLQVDHIDGNPLNNQKHNLRVCNASQNACNKGASAKNSSGFKGVTWHKPTRKWLAQIKIDGKNHYLGLFTIPENAHAAYCKAALKLHGEFSRIA